ncbi:hypothetical protein BDR05DRAFT_943266 [Suillus weaverae]|nr:hypothetical protein BDR05DRAFT_943266 [Suillus weaverae]
MVFERPNEFGTSGCIVLLLPPFLWCFVMSSTVERIDKTTGLQHFLSTFHLAHPRPASLIFFIVSPLAAWRADPSDSKVYLTFHSNTAARDSVSIAHFSSLHRGLAIRMNNISVDAKLIICWPRCTIYLSSLFIVLFQFFQCNTIHAKR